MDLSESWTFGGMARFLKLPDSMALKSPNG